MELTCGEAIIVGKRDLNVDRVVSEMKCAS